MQGQRIHRTYSRKEPAELKFKDAKVERAYRKFVSKDIFAQIRIFKYFTLIATIIVLTYETVVGWKGTLLPTLLQLPGFLNPTALLVTVYLNVGLHCVPKKMAEQFMCALTLFAIVGFLGSNPYRIQRIYPREGFPTNLPASERIWMERCDTDLGESARDSLHVAWALAGNSIFHIFMRARSKLTWVMPACISAVGSLVAESGRQADRSC